MACTLSTLALLLLAEIGALAQARTATDAYVAQLADGRRLSLVA
jgi:hypothetical protein